MGRLIQREKALPKGLARGITNLGPESDPPAKCPSCSEGISPSMQLYEQGALGMWPCDPKAS